MRIQKYNSILMQVISFSAPIVLSLNASATLIPAAPTLRAGQDPLMGYQYSLLYTSQEVNREIDDITSVRAIRDPNHSVDIGIPFDSSLDSQMKKDVVVAVIDSGLDINHPEIRHALYKNTLECVNNEIPYLPTEDKDKNGYIGDCTGWDFSTANGKGSNHQEDESGHGTHVAGIIAAERGNGTGIGVGTGDQPALGTFRSARHKAALPREGHPT